MDALKNLLCVVGLIGLMLLSSYVGWRAGVRHVGKNTYIDTSYVTFVDTQTFYQPIPRDSVIVRYVTRVLKKVTEPEAYASGTVASDTLLGKTVNDQLNGDSVDVEVPITQKVYSDSSYIAYVSGYEASLDSISIIQKEVTKTIFKAETIEKKKFLRWNVGLIGGYGYGFQSNTFELFIGVGLTISLF